MRNTAIFRQLSKYGGRSPTYRCPASGNEVHPGGRGVAFLWKENCCSLKKIDYKNPDDFEVLIAAGSVKGHTRKLAVPACYLPPGLSKREGEAALEHINRAFFYKAPSFEAREAHRYLKSRLGTFCARGGGLLDNPYAPCHLPSAPPTEEL